MAHALAAYFRDLDFDTAFLADDALVFHALILAAQAFIILDRTKDARAEQAVTFGLERAVVDGFGLLDLAERPRANTLRARDADLDPVERSEERRVGKACVNTFRVRGSAYLKKKKQKN